MKYEHPENKFCFQDLETNDYREESKISYDKEFLIQDSDDFYYALITKI